MSSPKSSKSLLSEYKYLLEERDSVNDLYQKGCLDLTFYLHELKADLSEKVPGQVEKFENQFFNKPPVSGSDPGGQVQPLGEDAADQSSESEVELKEQWAKKLYREIVLVTHPDKTASIGIPKLITKLLKFYNITVEAYEKNKFEDLLFVGYELDIDLPDDKVQIYIAPKLKDMSGEIQQKKSSFPYLWETLEEEKRSIILENYLKSIGYVFDKKIIEETIERVKRIKRKVGTRPVNHLKNRLL